MGAVLQPRKTAACCLACCDYFPAGACAGPLWPNPWLVTPAEPPTAPRLRRRAVAVDGAGEGNRTLVISLEGFCSTIELHPHAVFHLTVPLNSAGFLLPLHQTAPRVATPRVATPQALLSATHAHGGGGWIRTNVGVSQQIYSLPPLATRAPLQGTANYGLPEFCCQTTDPSKRRRRGLFRAPAIEGFVCTMCTIVTR